MSRFIAVTMLALSLSGCVVYDDRPNHYRGRPVVVHERDDYYYTPAYRCPPGHARKGWC